MNIVLATDDNFVQHCGVAMVSILRNNKNTTFYLLTEGLTSENEKILKSLVIDNGGNLVISLVPSDIVKYFPMSKMASSHISIATYYRLFVTSLLPETIDKAIYLDCDMVVRGSLADLWETYLDGYALGAVYQNLEWSDNEGSWSRLDIPREYGYFNAGTLLLNLKYLRENKFQEKAIEFINEHFENIVSHDQDVLNAMFYDRVKPLSCKWNFTPLFMQNNLDDLNFPTQYDYKNEINNTSFTPIIIHFVSKPKPWQYGCSNKYTTEYYKYLEMTYWKDFKPEFNFMMFVKDVVIQSVKMYIKRHDKHHIIDYIKKRR